MLHAMTMYVYVVCYRKKQDFTLSISEVNSTVKSVIHVHTIDTCPNRSPVCKCKGLGAHLLISIIKPVVRYLQYARIE